MGYDYTAVAKQIWEQGDISVMWSSEIRNKIAQMIIQIVNTPTVWQESNRKTQSLHTGTFDNNPLLQMRNVHHKLNQKVDQQTLMNDYNLQNIILMFDPSFLLSLEG